MIKAVFDINVLVRIALGRTPAARLLRAVWENRGFTLVISEEILDELALVMHYPRIAERYNFTETDWRNFESALRGTAIMVPGMYFVERIEADPSDDKLLACALEGQADYLVSDDPHLRDLKYYHGVQIISLEQFSVLLGLT
ncbi:MAG: putative toxin-antitoxin system toxin component, PIN family [Anaerolineae bacterium]